MQTNDVTVQIKIVHAVSNLQEKNLKTDYPYHIHQFSEM
jgi:hypothetical protein